MEYTDEEASVRFCPLLANNCRGSNCMFWRKGGSRETSQQMVEKRDYDGRYHAVPVRVDEGHCGIADGLHGLTRL